MVPILNFLFLRDSLISSIKFLTFLGKPVSTYIALLSLESETLLITSAVSNAINEEFYGGFITLQGKVTEFKNSYLYLDDGAGEIKIAFGKSKALQNIKLTHGDQIAATGILVTTKSGYHLETRLPDDIQILNQTPPTIEEKTAERGYSNWAGLIPLAILMLVGIANIKKLKKLIPKK